MILVRSQVPCCGSVAALAMVDKIERVGRTIRFETSLSSKILKGSGGLHDLNGSERSKGSEEPKGSEESEEPNGLK